MLPLVIPHDLNGTWSPPRSASIGNGDKDTSKNAQNKEKQHSISSQQQCNKAHYRLWANEQTQPLHRFPLVTRVVRKYSGVATGSLVVVIGVTMFVGAARATRPVWARFLMVGRVKSTFGCAVSYERYANLGASGHPHWRAVGRSFVGNRQMSALLSFQFKQESVRIVVVEDEPWFVAADLCAILAISNVTNAMKRLDDDEVTLYQIKGASNGKPVNIVSESGMWMLVLRSDKPEAVDLRRWLSRDVLPSIRKTGRYEVPGFDPPPMQASDLDPTRLVAGVSVVREARRLFGPGAARTLWAQVGLPPVTPDSEGLNDADPLAEPLRAYLCGRAETSIQEAAEGIGIQHPDHTTRHRLGRIMAMWGWTNKTRKVGRKATRVYSRPAAQVTIDQMPDDMGEIA